MAKRCEGWRRYGGMMTFGPVKWVQCEKTAVVNLTVLQDGEEQTLPACMDCWKECIETKVQILKAEPLVEEKSGN